MRRQPSEHFLHRLKEFRQKSPSSTEPLNPPSSNSISPKQIGRFIFRVLEVLGLVFIIPAAYALIIDLEDRQSQRIAQAWQLVTQQAPGNSGKIQALEYLNSESGALSWPKKNSLSLRGLDLSIETHKSSVYLFGVDLSGASLRKANLSGASLWKANLSRAYLEEANLSGASLWKANLSRAYLEEANLSGAVLWKANLSGAVLRKADLSGADFWGANLSGADFWGANLSGAVLRKADLSDAELSDANLSDAKLWKTDLSGASLRKANLSGAVLRKADLSGANLRGANLSGANLKGANLSGANVTGALFSEIPKRYVLSEALLLPRELLPLQIGAYYFSGDPPKIAPSFLKYFTPIGLKCTWIQGLKYFECALL